MAVAGIGGGTVRVLGYRELMMTFRTMGVQAARGPRNELREIGNLVRDDARSRFERYDSKSAAGYRTRVRQRGVAVEQSLARTTGKRPDFGTLQMTHALEPALDEKTEEVEVAFEAWIDRMATREGF